MVNGGTSTQVTGVPVGPGLVTLLDALRPASGDRRPVAAATPLGPNASPEQITARIAEVNALLDEATGWQRTIAWADSRLNELILGITGINPTPDDDDWGREEIASALRLSAQTASERIDVARALGTRLILTRAALQKGQITLRHATEIAKALEPLTDDDVCARVEEKILAGATGRTPAQLARHARAEVIRADPQSADERHRKARRTRRVEFSPLPDGMAELRAFLPAVGAARLRAKIDELAGRTATKGDSRTIDQRRADAIVALGQPGVMQSRAAGSHPPAATDDTNPEANEPPTTDEPDGPSARRAARSRIALIAPLSTVLGATHLPGDLINYGPVPPTVVRELAADAKWEKWSTDPAGTITDLGRTTYRPPAGLANLIRATHPRCVFPGCSQPSYRCDLDHVVRWADGGRTSNTNIIPLCRRHHRAKDEAGWRLTRNNDGSCDWISPAGREYHVDALRYLESTGDGDEDGAFEEDWTVDLSAPAKANARGTAGTEQASRAEDRRLDLPAGASRELLDDPAPF